MAFGVLFDFTGNSNVSKVIKAADMVKQPWFQEAVNTTKPVDLFVIAGHNPVRTSVSSSTFGTVFNAIRKVRPDVPIQGFGGHTHIRDFVVYDNKATGIESGEHQTTNNFLPKLTSSRSILRNSWLGFDFWHQVFDLQSASQPQRRTQPFAQCRTAQGYRHSIRQCSSSQLYLTL
jgi:hypothetical protein